MFRTIQQQERPRRSMAECFIRAILAGDESGKAVLRASHVDTKKDLDRYE